MYVNKINFNSYLNPKNFQTKPVSSPYSQGKPMNVSNKNIAFCHNNFTVSHEEVTKLINYYKKSFDRDMKFFVEGGNSILQPHDIPAKTLYNIAKAELYKMHRFLNKYTLYIVTGRIGGGKTSFVKQNRLEESFYTPDADTIKPLLPGYNERGAEYVHLASCGINNANFSMALKKGINTLFQTATTFDNIDNIIDEARDYKYKDIVMIHIDTNEENAIRRALLRGVETGRKINPDVIKERKYIDEIASTYKTPLRGVNRLLVYNNDGEYPVKVEDIRLDSAPDEFKYVTENDK